ncbi:hypothetical protein DL95DRAFT_413534 [Leptodontidium sp. 2 PMI_412]|nr:hypothetical protein DL95DRAFT_413534 [Leptodontidium sp. 2 PMI_412]
MAEEDAEDAKDVELDLLRMKQFVIVIPTALNISTDATALGLAKAILPFVSLEVFEEIIALDPLSAYPSPGVYRYLEVLLALPGSTVQKAWIAFATFLDPNALGSLSPGAEWSRYQSENVMVFQKVDGSGEQANGTSGTPVGQGLHEEKDPDNRSICDFYAENDMALER